MRFLGVRIFNQMAQLSPTKMKQLLDSQLGEPEKWHHIRKFMDLVEYWVQSASDLPRIATQMTKIGRAHALLRPKGFRREYFEVWLLYNI